jgi:hypothetical protein
MSKETIEEAAERFSKLRKKALEEKKEWSPDCIYHESFNGFMVGAECQAERMYSEEEVKSILLKTDRFLKADLDIWFDQNKKQKP